MTPVSPQTVLRACFAVLASASLIATAGAAIVRAQGPSTPTEQPAKPEPATPEAPEPAPSEEPVEPETPEGLTPPELLEFVPTDADPELIAKAGGAEVLLALTIDSLGKVTEVVVEKSAGEPFDALASKAAAAFVFRAATKDGKPIASRIRYLYQFVDLTPHVASVGSLELHVLGTEGDAPLVGAAVEVLDESGSVVTTGSVAADGVIRAESLPPGTYRVVVTPAQGNAKTYEESVQAGQVTQVTYRIGEEATAAPAADFGVTAVVDRPAREAIKRTLIREELTRVAGTRGDALRALELLPGVARPPFGVGVLIVRGAGPNESEAFLEGTPIPVWYHFGGLTSVVNSLRLESIDFYPGNFSTRYGRRLGAIVELTMRDPATDRGHMAAEISPIDVWATGEGPIGKNVAISASLRRSTIDLILPAVMPEDSNITAAPVYYDYQFQLTWRPTKRDRIRFKAYGSNDRFAIITNDESVGSDPAVRGKSSLLTRFNTLQVNWDRRFSKKLEQETSFGVGPTKQTLRFGDAFNFNLLLMQMYVRSEFRAQLSKRFQLIGGIDMSIAPTTVQYSGPPPGATEGGGANAAPFASEEKLSIDRKGTIVRPAAYVEASANFDSGTRIVLGGRVDYFNEIHATTFDPRAVAIQSIGQRTRVKAGLGMFTQPPEIYESDDTLGNPRLKPTRTVHHSLGAEYDVSRVIQLGVESFYKPVWSRVIPTDPGDYEGVDEDPKYSNDGKGRIFGGELSFVAHADNYFARLSYTYSKSQRWEPNDGWRVFDFDQPHILIGAFSYRFKRNWEIGSAVRVYSGNPYTPIIGGIEDVSTGTTYPIEGRVNSERNKMYHQVDLRVAKVWKFTRWQLTFFVDVRNVYNHRNPEGKIYQHDFRASQTILGLPVIPALGLRGEM